MKTFYTDGTGSQQTLNDSQTEKVVVYDTINDAEADLANLAEGQIIATKDDNFEGNAVPVNEVAVDNMHSVTSNAVYEVTKNIDSWLGDFGVDCFKIGRIVLFKLRKEGLNQASPAVIGYIPERFRPYSINIRFVLLNNNNDEPCGQGVINADGKISLYHQNGANLKGAYYADIVYFAND